jgi:hypothetical protein
VIRLNEQTDDNGKEQPRQSAYRRAEDDRIIGQEKRSCSDGHGCLRTSGVLLSRFIGRTGKLPLRHVGPAIATAEGVKEAWHAFERRFVQVPQSEPDIDQPGP